MLPELTRSEVQRYSRHLLLPEVGLEGQRKLKAASVLIVGCGGLGSPLALYLAAAGIGRIGIVDYDAVEDSNLQRQVIHSIKELGDPKVKSARKRMLDLNPYIQVDAILDVFSSENAEEIAGPYDILVDGTDNFPTRYLLNDFAVLHGKPYVYGSIFRFEGQVSVFDARHGPCYRCLFPVPPPPGMVPSCAEGGVLGILPGTVGTLQATEVIKLILGVGEPLIGKLMLYDALDSSFQMVKLRKNPNCAICGPNPQITALIDYEEFCGVPSHGTENQTEDFDVSPNEVAARLAKGERLQLVDVREPVELQVASLPGARLIPLGELASRLGELSKNDEVALFCRTGTRSQRAVQVLLGAGFDRVKNMRGGMGAAGPVVAEMMEY